jgi:Zn-finger nucleic acid-binding protein
MARVIKVTEPEKELPCPRRHDFRGCGNLRYGKTWRNSQKVTNCKNCKGVMLTLDEIQTWGQDSWVPGRKKAARKLRSSGLENFLSSGTPCSLDCPKCSKKMVEIKLSYKKSRVAGNMQDAMLDPLSNPGYFIRGVPIVGEIFGVVMFLGEASQDIVHGKKTKSVTIDGCRNCHIFWFDKTELEQLLMNDVTNRPGNPNVNVAKKGTRATLGVSIVSVAEKEPNHLTSGNKIFVDGRWVPNPSFKTVKTKKE